mmetsp:Transcript_49427/g.139095  ORF Transcript_49427/g.139095 Transcript_49427/m.139095 type:complete len:205 (-) Transcript_49427:647-1261(-)
MKDVATQRNRLRLVPENVQADGALVVAKQAAHHRRGHIGALARDGAADLLRRRDAGAAVIHECGVSGVVSDARCVAEAADCLVDLPQRVAQTVDLATGADAVAQQLDGPLSLRAGLREDEVDKDAHLRLVAARGRGGRRGRGRRRGPRLEPTRRRLRPTKRRVRRGPQGGDAPRGGLLQRRAIGASGRPRAGDREGQRRPFRQW